MNFSTSANHADGAGLIGLIICSVVILFGAIAYFSYVARKRRREAVALLAQSLGLRFAPDKDRGLAKKYEKLDELRKGSNRYAFNVLRGDYEGHPVELFDYHYQITTSNGKSSSTRHYFLNVLVCRLPRRFPELRIYREGFFEKVVQFIGFEDIHFESAEFSKRYTVRSKDRKFAYDFVHARMMDFLMRGPDLNIEVEGEVLALVSRSRLDPPEIRGYLTGLMHLRKLMPEYLFTR